MATDHIFHSDEPVLDDDLDHALHVQRLAEMIISCKPPFVLGVHGDWGTGKTSFLRKLHLYLADENLFDQEPDKREKRSILWSDIGEREPLPLETIWFEAWRYQFETNPIVALLQEIRTHFTWKQQLVGASAKATFAALMSLEELTKKIGIQPSKIMNAGEKWESDTLAQALPSEVCRRQLEHAIDTVLGEGKRLVIFIDDLDRCRGDVAFRLLEAMKIYLSIPNCVFVLGLDWQNVQRAVASELTKVGMIPENMKESAMIYAKDYLNKIFQLVQPLPPVTQTNAYLRSLMKARIFKELAVEGAEFDSNWIDKINHYKLLPPNPRKIKAFINGFSYYLSELTQVLDQIDELTMDHDLALTIAYLKLNETAIYRILESDITFWDTMVEFCRSGSEHIHDVFNSRTLSDLAIEDETSSAPEYSYQSAFRDPADERVFRPAQLIRNWRDGAPPTTQEFEVYLYLRAE